MIKIITLVLGLLMSVGTPEDLQNISVYPQTMVVSAIDETEHTLTLATFTCIEYLYEVEEIEEWVEGDVCSLLMNDCGTESVFDDEIISLKYSGWVDVWGWDIENNCPLYAFIFD